MTNGEPGFKKDSFVASSFADASPAAEVASVAEGRAATEISSSQCRLLDMKLLHRLPVPVAKDFVEAAETVAVDIVLRKGSHA